MARREAFDGVLWRGYTWGDSAVTPRGDTPGGTAPEGHSRALSLPRDAAMSSRGRAAVDLAATRFARAQEEQATSGGGAGRDGAGSLSPAALRQVVAAALREALSSRMPALEEGQNAQAATVQELSAAVAELRNIITNVASPAPAQGTVVMKKAKRYELGQSTSREKARLRFLAMRKRAPAGPTPTRRPPARPCAAPQVTQGVYSLLLKDGLHYKPTDAEVSNILTSAMGENAPDADVELSKHNVHACVRAPAHVALSRD